jgi:hypothetical protein
VDERGRSLLAFAHKQMRQHYAMALMLAIRAMIFTCYYPRFSRSMFMALTNCSACSISSSVSSDENSTSS